jgi:hypothetical protein
LPQLANTAAAASRGVEIAAALGISTDELRRWRDTAPRTNTLPAGPSPRVGWESPANQQPADTVLVAMGDATVNGNDFASEAACVRKALNPAPR